MSLGQVGSLAGNIIGSYFGGPVGGAIGSFIGGQIGGSLDPAINNYGPRLSDLKLQNGSYGTPIAVSFGTSRVAGTVIYLTDIREHSSTEREGKGGQRVYDTSYSYDLDFAVVLTDQHGFPVKDITGVRRIWANGALVSSNAETASLGTLIASGKFCDQITVYPGDYDQMPDPTLEAALGVGNVSAYRGFSYGVFRGVKVAGQGSPLPQMEFEIVQGGTVSVAKTIFSSIQPKADEIPQAGDTWCGADSTLVANYTLDVQHIRTSFFQPGVTVPEVNTLPSVYDSYSGFLRRFTNCVTSPIMYDVNYATSDVGAGMTLRLWNMKGAVGLPEADPGIQDNFLIASRLIPVLSYPYYSMVGTDARVAYEEATNCLAYGSRRGPSYYYGQRVMFGVAGVGADCVLPTNRQTIDFGIYLGILYVWNFDTTGVTSPVAGYNTFITAYDQAGTILFDDPHTFETFQVNASDTWARICCNEFGVFTWCASGPTRVTRYTPHGPEILCTDADSGGSDNPVGDSGQYQGFWCNGDIATIGGSSINGYDQTSHCWTIQFKAITKGTVELGYALSVICGIAGLDVSTEVDVTAQTQTLRGYSYKQIGTAVSFLQPLCTDFYTEGFESEGKIKFRTLGGDTVADISYDDLGWAIDGSDAPEPFPLTRIHDKDLPRSLSVVYANWDADFQVGSETPSKRLVTDSQNDVQIETPVTSTAGEAVKRQDVLLYKAWLERDQRKTTLSRQFVALEPSDPVNVEYPRGVWKRYRAQRTSYQGSVIDIDFVPDSPETIISSAVSSNVARGQVDIPVISPAIVSLLDMPLLRDSDNGFGFYAAFSGYGSNSGATLYERNESGTYDSVASASTKTAIGAAQSVLADWTGGNVFDTRSTVRVYVGSAALSNATRTVVLATTTNTMLIGEEIIQFCVATPVAGQPGVYDLSVLRRYLRGTSWAAPHAIGDPVVLLQISGMRRIVDTAADRNVTKLFKAVSTGLDVNTTSAKSFTNTDVGLKPFPPTDLAVSPTTPLVLTWHRRSRLSSRFLAAGQTLPLGEVTEAYEVDVLDGTGAVASTIAAATARAEINGWLKTAHLNDTIFARMWQAQPFGTDYVFGFSQLGSSAAGNEIVALVSYALNSPQRLSTYIIINNDNLVGGQASTAAKQFRVNGSNLYLSTQGPDGSGGGLSRYNASDLIDVFSNSVTPAAVFAPGDGSAGSFDFAPNGVWCASVTAGVIYHLDANTLARIDATTLDFYERHGRVLYSASNARLYIVTSANSDGFTVKEYDVSGDSPVLTRSITPIALTPQPFFNLNYTDLAIFGSYLVVGMIDGLRFYDLATLTLQRTFSSVIPFSPGTAYAYAGSDMLTVTPNGFLAFTDTSRGGVVFLNGALAVANTLPFAVASSPDSVLPSVGGSTFDGVVIASGGRFSLESSTGGNSVGGAFVATGGSLNVYKFSDFSSGDYTAKVYQMSATVGRGFPSEAIALG